MTAVTANESSVMSNGKVESNGSSKQNGQHANGTAADKQVKQDSFYWYEPPPVLKAPKGAQHGVKGVYYAGNWLDIEDCHEHFVPSNCASCDHKTACPRSMSRNAKDEKKDEYDVLVIGAGCIGAAVARELSRYNVSVLWVEAADDVSQGATKGNSGIVHAGYDDKPGTNRAKYCWKGNQMFAQLDRELRFGYQKNGSLVVAFNEKDREHLEELKKRGDRNGVQFLRIIEQDELRRIEPHINPDAIAALYCPEAGNVIPYEYAIALAENAVDNGVQLRIRREVEAIESDEDGWKVTLNHWEPSEYVEATAKRSDNKLLLLGLAVSTILGVGGLMYAGSEQDWRIMAATLAAITSSVFVLAGARSKGTKLNFADFTSLVETAGRAVGLGGTAVEVPDMLVGGSGSNRIQHGVTVEKETVRAKYIVNCAGGASDQIAKMIGDESFYIKPRLGDYILLNRNQGHLAKQTLFPCPDPVLGKGVLCQTTLWKNLILGPTARDMHTEEARSMTPADIQEYILAKCKFLIPKFDAKETIHSFCGARAKNSRGDWIIEPSVKNSNMIHVAGIDSPGLAGSPAIALEVIRLLQDAGLDTPDNPDFNPNRAPIITPKDGMKGLKFGPVGKNDSDRTDEAKMAANVICKCERVTELEVVRAMRRSLPIDSSQGIRKRTRAGMGHCQGDPDNYNCEARVKAIIARELNVPMEEVGGRPWPATSILTERWIGDEEKNDLERRMKNGK